MQLFPRKSLRCGTVSLCCVVYLCALTACGGVHLYDEEKDNAAKAIKSAKDAIDISSAFTTARSNLDDLLAHELRIRGELTDQIRNRRLWAIIDDQKTLSAALLPTLPDGTNYPSERLRALGVTSVDERDSDKDLMKAVLAWEALGPSDALDPGARTQKVLEAARKALIKDTSWSEKDVWSCEEILLRSPQKPNLDDPLVQEAAKAASVEDSSLLTFKLNFVAYHTACIDSDEDQAAIVALDAFGGLIGEAYDRYAESQLDEIQLKREQSEARSKINAVSTDNEGSTETEASIEDFQKTVANVAEQISEATTLADALGFDQVLTEERIGALRALLLAFSNGSLEGLGDEALATIRADPHLHRAGIVAAGIPSIAMDLQSLAKILNEPPGRAGVAIELQQLKIRRNYLNARAQNLAQRTAHLKGLLRARLNEARLIFDARKFALESDSLKNETVVTIDSEVPDESTDKDKRYAFAALISFDQSITVARREADQIEYQLIDLQHRRALLADEYAARSWAALIDGPVEQIAAYYGSGIKPEEIANFVQGLGALGLLGFVAVETD